MDEPDLASKPSLSSSLDDTFYILKKTLYRLLSTASIETLVSTCKEVRRIMDKDVAEVWRAAMDGAFKDVASGGGVVRAREEEKERRERDAKAVFVVGCPVGVAKKADPRLICRPTSTTSTRRPSTLCG